MRNTPDLADLDDLAQLPLWLITLLLDRIDAGYREGLFEMSIEAYSGLCMCICPDEFPMPPEPPKPTNTPPGSGGSLLNGTRNESQRVKVYMNRVRDGFAIWCRDDAKGDQFDRGIRPVWEGNQEPKAGGWQDERARAKPKRRAKKRRAR